MKNVIKTLFWGSLAACVAIVVLVMFKMLGPIVEQRVLNLNPVKEMVFLTQDCQGNNTVVHGYMDKAHWPNGVEAEFDKINGLTIFDSSAPAQRLAWRRPDIGDNSAVSRPAGVQAIKLYIVGGCAKEFTMHTRHISPMTGLVLRQTWGPFNPPRS